MSSCPVLHLLLVLIPGISLAHKHILPMFVRAAGDVLTLQNAARGTRAAFCFMFSVRSPAGLHELHSIISAEPQIRFISAPLMFIFDQFC